MIPANYVEISGPDFIVELMYAGLNHNMTGRAVYQEIGLGNHAYIHQDMWQVLQKAIPWLRAKNLKMKIFDAARPVIAHQKLLELIPIKGYFAAAPEKSQHCHGTAIDVCLCRADGTELTYPTLVDAYSPKLAQEVQQGQTDNLQTYLQQARHDYMDSKDPTAISNRQELKALMESIGLNSIPHEWWHYNLPHGLDYPLFEY